MFTNRIKSNLLMKAEKIYKSPELTKIELMPETSVMLVVSVSGESSTDPMHDPSYL